MTDSPSVKSQISIKSTPTNTIQAVSYHSLYPQSLDPKKIYDVPGPPPLVLTTNVFSDVPSNSLTGLKEIRLSPRQCMSLTSSPYKSKIYPCIPLSATSSPQKKLITPNLHSGPLSI